jgi:endonuclease-3
MFCLDRAEFPVDTHVWRISKDMGWVPKSASREDTYEHMNAAVPDMIKYDMHVLLVGHGKKCHRCAKNGHNRKPADGDWCPLKGKDWAERVAAEEKLKDKEC